MSALEREDFPPFNWTSFCGLDDHSISASSGPLHGNRFLCSSATSTAGWHVANTQKAYHPNIFWTQVRVFPRTKPVRNNLCICLPKALYVLLAHIVGLYIVYMFGKSSNWTEECWKSVTLVGVLALLIFISVRKHPAHGPLHGFNCHQWCNCRLSEWIISSMSHVSCFLSAILKVVLYHSGDCQMVLSVTSLVGSESSCIHLTRVRGFPPV